MTRASSQTRWDFPWFAGMICKAINVMYLINKLKRKNHMLNSTDADVELEKFNFLYIKNLEQIRPEGISFNVRN